MKKYAVIVAGGSGQRMGTKVPKQFLLLNGKPVIQHTIQTFLAAYDDMQIILVLPAEHLTEGEQLIAKLQSADRIQIIGGGATRFHSVQNGLSLVTAPSVVFVHDGVRCLVSKKLIQNCYQQTLEKGSAIPAVAVTDSLRVDEGTFNCPLSRDKIRIIQTPQTFTSEILLPAFEQEYRISFTDEATVVEAVGTPVFLIEGDYNNLKVTRPIDLAIAAQLLQEQIDR